MKSFSQLNKIIYSTVFLFAFLIDPVLCQVDFTKHIVGDHYYGASSVCAYDINNDGYLDVLGTGHDSNRIAWWKNEGGSPLTFTMNLIDFTFFGAIFVDAADINNDGHIDVLGAAWEGNEIACWYNDGGNPITWTKSSIDAAFNGAHEVHTADVDGDGDIDVLGASAGNHQIAYWENDGGNPANWTKHIVGSLFLGARSVIGADVNNDGHTDIVGAALQSDEVAVWINDGNNPITWTKEIVDNTFDGSHWVHGVDFDNDGDFDIFGAAAIGSVIAWWRNEGGSPVTWTKQNIDFGFDAALSVATADLDGDGDLDAFGAATVADAVRWWRNDGGNPVQWTGINIDTNFDEAWGLFGADLDNDGDTDILSSAATDNEIAWYENTITTDVEDKLELPVNFSLEQNYPNPFNPSTTIGYSIAAVGTRHVVSVDLKIYDLLGNEVATLVSDVQNAGHKTAEWNGRNNFGSQVSSGVYFYVLKAGDFIQSKKMLLLK